MDLSKLKEPFAASDIEWRVQSSGEKDDKIWAKVLAYVTNRAVEDRLDEVCGLFNWQNSFKEGPDGGLLCGIKIWSSEHNEWVTKYDGADNTQVEAIKGGLSGAMKRAAVQWGIGRYLYRLDVGWANITANGSHSDKTKSGKWFKWSPPTLPVWALPTDKKKTTAETTEKEATSDEDHLELKNRVNGMLAVIKEAPGLPELNEYLKNNGTEIKAMPQKYQTELKQATVEMRLKFKREAEVEAEAEASGQSSMPMEEGQIPGRVLFEEGEAAA